jgi:methyl-accepting chemotaxis protein
MGSTMTIGKKLSLTTGGMVLATLVLGLAALNGISRLSDQFVNSTTRTARRLQLAGVIDATTGDMLAGQRGMVLYAYAKSPESVLKSKALFETASARWEQAVVEFRPLIATEEGRQLVSRLEEELSAWRATNQDILERIAAGDADGACKTGVEKVRPIYEAALRDTDRLIRLQNEILVEQKAAGDSLSSTGRLVTIVLMGVALAIGGFVLFVVRRTSTALQQTAADLAESASQVANASGQVSSSSQGLAQGASEQAASLEETSASSEEITSMTRKNADNSRTAAELMGETAHVVEQANRTLEQMEVSMREINESSDKVGKIIKVIDEIAFQTNILALNAAVEAARAGEAGMGFAVVADEVRNLAQRSAQAAKDTAGLIEESIAKSNEGRGKLDQVSVTIHTITESAQKVKTLVDEVKLGSEEQARGIEQISKAIAQMEQVTQKSAANAEETASAGEEMSAQAQTLKAIVEHIRELVGGSADGEAARPGSPGRLRAGHTEPVVAKRGEASTTAAKLRSLRGAVSGAGGYGKGAVGVPAGRSKSEIPLDDDFKEF